MRALVVYESMYGDAQTIAAAIAEGLSSHLDVSMCEVGSAPSPVPTDIALLVVGGPTHAMTLSRSSTRRGAEASMWCALREAFRAITQCIVSREG